MNEYYEIKVFNFFYIKLIGCCHARGFFFFSPNKQQIT